VGALFFLHLLGIVVTIEQNKTCYEQVTEVDF